MSADRDTPDAVDARARKQHDRGARVVRDRDTLDLEAMNKHALEWLGPSESDWTGPFDVFAGHVIALIAEVHYLRAELEAKSAAIRDAPHAEKCNACVVDGCDIHDCDCWKAGVTG